MPFNKSSRSTKQPKARQEMAKNRFLQEIEDNIGVFIKGFAKDAFGFNLPDAVISMGAANFRSYFQKILTDLANDFVGDSVPSLPPGVIEGHLMAPSDDIDQKPLSFFARKKNLFVEIPMLVPCQIDHHGQELHLDFYTFDLCEEMRLQDDEWGEEGSSIKIVTKEGSGPAFSLDSSEVTVVIHMPEMEEDDDD